MRKLLITLSLVLTFSSSKSQEKSIFYYNHGWALTLKEFATYYREATIDSDYLFDGKVRDYYMNGKPRMIGKYDKGIKEGPFIFFYPSGQVKTQGFYRNNERYGIWASYYETGNLKDKIVYDNRFLGVLEHYNPDGEALLIDGTGRWSTTYFNYQVMEIIKIEGQYLDSLRHGIWRYYETNKVNEDNELEIRCEENYDNGSFVGGTYYWGKKPEKIYKPMYRILPNSYKFERTEKWFSTAYVSIGAYPKLKFLPEVDSAVFPVNKHAFFPEGNDKLTQYFRSNLRFTRDYINSQKIRSIRLLISIDELGKVKIQDAPDYNHWKRYPGSSTFGKQVLKSTRKMPDWIPAQRNGKRVKSYYRLKVEMDSGLITCSAIPANKLL